MNAPGPGNHGEHNSPLPAGGTRLPPESHSQAVEQPGHREASNSSHSQPVASLPVASLWEDHRRDQEPIPGIFRDRDHSSVISLTGRLRDQGLVAECKRPQGYEEQMAPEFRIGARCQPIRLRSQS